MPLHRRQPAHGPDEEGAGVDTQLPPDFPASPRRPHLAQIHAVVNLNHRGGSVSGILEGFRHALRDSDHAVREAPEDRLVERLVGLELRPAPTPHRFIQAMDGPYHVGHARELRRHGPQDIVFVTMGVDDLDVVIS